MNYVTLQLLIIFSIACSRPEPTPIAAPKPSDQGVDDNPGSQQTISQGQTPEVSKNAYVSIPAGVGPSSQASESSSEQSTPPVADNTTAGTPTTSPSSPQSPQPQPGSSNNQTTTPIDTTSQPAPPATSPATPVPPKPVENTSNTSEPPAPKPPAPPADNPPSDNNGALQPYAVKISGPYSAAPVFKKPCVLYKYYGFSVTNGEVVQADPKQHPSSCNDNGVYTYIERGKDKGYVPYFASSDDMSPKTRRELNRVYDKKSIKSNLARMY